MKSLIIATLLALLAVTVGFTQSSQLCPTGALPTRVSIVTEAGKAEGTLCGTYPQETFVGPYLYEEDFRKILESKGFVVLDEHRPLRNVR